jgi:hypothetical protein
MEQGIPQAALLLLPLAAWEGGTVKVTFFPLQELLPFFLGGSHHTV